MNTTSITLLQRLRATTDREAWDRFVDLYTPLLYHWARKCQQQPHDAADLVQDVFAALIKKLPEFRYNANLSFRAWLRTVTRNLLRERLRSPGTRPMNALSLEAAESEHPDAIAELTELEYRGYLVNRALELMQRDFEPSTWKAVLAYTIGGQSAAEVARTHGLTVGAVYGAKFRVVTRLREELDGLLD
ncbi:MAG: sigma-70 family RNA polymerase sigma factor [Gemmataceae bacterium]|nr:sigma-70 family RNA polymerase sigma factor [Gemmataceae bacterium]